LKDARQVPEGFVFAVKMSRYLTHIRRLRDPAVPIERFRHPSWHDDDVWSALDRAGSATVLAYRPRVRVRSVVTGGWSYVRFHQGTILGPGYRRSTLLRWAHRICELPARRTYVYFNNDPGGAAVHDAEVLRSLLAR
jgi:uncharacterized protein YecE (DUF72 family)